MRFRSGRLLFFTLVSLAMSALALADRDQEAALQLLVHAFDRVGARNVVAIMQLPLHGAEADFETVKVQIDMTGKQKTTVLQPIHESGLVILDLSTYREIYNPDEQSLTIGMSPVDQIIKPEERLALVRRNYRVTVTPRVHLAGQLVSRVDATPYHAGMCRERIYIDPASYFVLRVESIAPNGNVKLRFDTKAVTYPPQMESDVFTLTNVTITKTEHLTLPIPVKDPAQAAQKVGFKPLVPRRLPLGFKLRKTYVRIDSSTHYVVFNLSDGLATAAVFQMKRAKVPASWKSELQQHPNDYFWSGDTLVRIVSDLEPATRQQLLRSFKSADRAMRETPENPFKKALMARFANLFGTESLYQGVTDFGSGWRTHKQIG